MQLNMREGQKLQKEEVIMKQPKLKGNGQGLIEMIIVIADKELTNKIQEYFE